MSDISLASYLKELKKDDNFYCDYINVTEKEISKRVGISESSFHKNYTARRKTRKVNRDFFIAVFAVLSLGTDDINDFFTKYDENIPLISDDDDSCKRDRTISEILEGNFDKKNYIDTNYVNEILTTRGLNKLDLNLVEKSKNENKFIILDTKITIDNNATYDMYDSIENTYHLNRFHYNGKALIRNKKNNDMFELSYFNENSYSVIPIKKNELIYDRTVRYKNIDETGEYKSCFVSLCTSVDGKTKISRSIVNDTKNYKERCAARFYDGYMHYFAETYNFDIPEINEYYLLEYSNDNWKFVTSNKSMFMKHYLNDYDYHMFYGKNDFVILSEHINRNEIESAITKSNSINNLLNGVRLEYWNKLECSIFNLKTSLKNKEIFIRNLDEIYEPNCKDYVCEFYKVDKDFDCVNNGYDYIANKAYIMYSPDERKKIKIKIEDVYRAYELGLNSINEIYEIISKYKEIDNIL